MGERMTERPVESTETPQEGDAPSSQTWARRLQRGEPGAVEEVRVRVARILAHSALAIPQQERDDLEQEVLTEIWQSVNRSRFEVSAGFWGFVEVVTSRRSIDWLRARRERLPLPEALEFPGRGPLRRTLERERVEVASAVLSALDAPCQELIAFRLRDDLSFAEIAQSTGKSEGALRVQLHRCVERARRLAKGIREGRQQGARPGRGDR